MTKEEILALPAGLQLDALVAERVLGQTGLAPAKPDAFWDVDSKNMLSFVPRYSTDISAAWQVVAKRQRTFGSFLALRWDDFYKRWRYVEGQLAGDATWVVEAEADTAPLAICRAAFLTLWRSHEAG